MWPEDTCIPACSSLLLGGVPVLLPLVKPLLPVCVSTGSGRDPSRPSKPLDQLLVRDSGGQCCWQKQTGPGVVVDYVLPSTRDSRTVLVANEWPGEGATLPSSGIYHLAWGRSKQHTLIIKPHTVSVSSSSASLSTYLPSVLLTAVPATSSYPTPGPLMSTSSSSSKDIQE